jgi:hypothetical protein
MAGQALPAEPQGKKTHDEGHSHDQDGLRLPDEQ